MNRKPKQGVLTEFKLQVEKADRDLMEASIMKADFADVDHIFAIYQVLVAKMLAGQLSPEVAAECREVMVASTTLAAAKAQGVFNSESALDGVMVLAAAAKAAKERQEAPQIDTIDDDTF